MSNEYRSCGAEIYWRYDLALLFAIASMGVVGCGEASDEKPEETGPPIPFCGLGDLSGGQFESRAYGVSADGKVVVGCSSSAKGDEEAFRWSRSQGMQGLGGFSDPRFGLARIHSRANGVSGDGTVVVGSSNGGSTKAFRWTKADGMQELGALPGHHASSNAYAISGDGTTIVGSSSSVGGDQAFRWTKSEGMIGLGRLPESGEHSGSARDHAFAVSTSGHAIVGKAKSGNGSEAFLWSGAMRGLGDLSGKRFQSGATAVSGDGSIVVGSGRDTSNGDRAFKWTAAKGVEFLDELPGGNVYANASAFSHDGSTIVGESHSAVGAEAVRWTEKKGVESIQKLLADRGVDTAGWQITSATAVSADGSVIVGNGKNPQGQQEAWRADLSVPATAP